MACFINYLEKIKYGNTFLLNIKFNIFFMRWTNEFVYRKIAHKTAQYDIMHFEALGPEAEYFARRKLKMAIKRGRNCRVNHSYFNYSK